MSTVEEQRVIELYKYYVSDHISDDELVSQPEGTDTSPCKSIDSGAQVCGIGIHETSQTFSPHTTLTALCQLAAIRLGVQRVGISLIARHAQYILAESTRTLNLRDTTKSDETEDSLWMGLTQCNRMGNLCENTICLPSARDADVPPCFVVPDLRQDPRFCNAPYVAERPFLKFYCGTPITTASNLNIGSFWVIDDRLLSEFTSDQKRLFGTMSSLVMRQLEMDREVSERQRAMKMGQALSSFVEGKLPIARPQALKQDFPFNGPSEAAYDPADDSTSTPATTAPQDHIYNREPIQNSRLTTLKEESSMDSHDTSSTSVHSTCSDESEPEETIDLTFARAAYLIREALDVQCCVFLDAASSQGTDSAGDSNRGHERIDLISKAVPARGERIGEAANNGAVTRTTTSRGVSAEVLAFAADSGSSLGGDSPASGTGFEPIGAGLLNGLTKRYPNGTMWTFGEAGLITLPGNIRPVQLSGRRTSSSNVKAWKRQRESDAASLRPCFPCARQLIFVPLFDAALERLTAGCFAFTNRRSRVMTIESEVVFLKSFVNNVGAELSRMNTIAADRSKSDFIGSISHELRSPLHGLLAAAEFLEETQLDSYQKSLIATQVSCGKTLLQVIEHVLDFSKINSLVQEEPTAGDRDSGRMLGTKIQAHSVETDIAELFEEVIEGSVAGKAHIAQDTAALNSRPSSMTTSMDTLAQKLHHNSLQNRSSNDVYPGVAVLLEFDYQQDWTFTTQPGALRRILMNVLGNALKYTDSGFVKIRLSMAEFKTSGDADSPSMITLSVADTGKGISKSFLRTRLFRPFNQEDHLSTGCGLGLSMVQSLVISLKGTLQIQSEQGVGTTVSIKLPLIRGKQNSTRHRPIELPHSEMQHLSPVPVMSPTVALLRPIKRSSAPEEHIMGDRLAVREEIKISVLKTMLDWLHMRPFDPTEGIGYAEYVVFLADEISAIEIGQSTRNSKAIALLPHNSTRGGTEDWLARNFTNFETITAPFGPRKLTRTVATCGNNPSSQSRSPRKKVEAFLLDHAESDNVETPPAAVRAQNALSRKTQDGDPIIPNFHSTQVARGLTEITNDAHIEHEKAEALDMGTTSDQFSPVTQTDGVENVLLPSKQEDISEPKAVTRKHSARLLLVDDNKINLSLLETFVKRHKRKPLYDCAENGLLAVNAARQNQSGYDLIFMDVSMPVMEGLEATREIRKLERERVARLGEAAAPPPALIVALTGLADGRNQENAFASGVDLFMTKPTKFKEIGSLIEEWYSKRAQDAGVRSSNPPKG